MRTHYATVYRSGECNGMDYDFTIEVEYTITPGCPETRPTYACGGTPAEPPEIEITKAVCETHGDVELTDAEIERLMEDHDWGDYDHPDL